MPETGCWNCVSEYGDSCHLVSGFRMSGHVSHSLRQWISQPRPTRLYYATRGRIFKLCMHYENNATVLGGQVYHLLLFLRMRPANQPTISGVALCHQKFGRPWLRHRNSGPSVQTASKTMDRNLMENINYSLVLMTLIYQPIIPGPTWVNADNIVVPHQQNEGQSRCKDGCVCFFILKCSKVHVGLLRNDSYKLK